MTSATVTPSISNSGRNIKRCSSTGPAMALMSSGVAKSRPAMAAAARERGCSRLYWTTQETNATARRLYDRVAQFRGFIRYEYPL